METSPDTTSVNQVIISVIFTVKKDQTTAMNPSGTNPFFVSSAFACSCVGPHVKDLITELSIVSSGDIDEDHPAGSEIVGLFAPEVTYGDGVTVDVPLVPLYEEQGVDIVGGTNRFGLLTKPPVGSVHVFTVKMTLDSGAEFEGTTGAVVITE